MIESGTEQQEAGPFRVLSLDGGGVKGVFSAGFLAGIEAGTGQVVSDHFDLIVGTSTGGVIALGLGLGMSGAEILSFYEHYGPVIFARQPSIRPLGRLAGIFGPRYSQEPLRRALGDVFGERTLGESKNRLVVVSYDGVAGDIHLLKTAHRPRFTRDHKRLALEVGLATTAAPVYFPSSLNDGRCEIDGGVWAACPAAVGAIEALRVIEPRPSAVSILSLGTTSEPFHVRHAWRKAGLGRWNKGLVALLQQAQVRGALAEAELLVGKDRFLRIDYQVEPGRFKLDDPSTIDELADLGRRAARMSEPEVQRRFLSESVEPFVPYNQ